MAIEGFQGLAAGVCPVIAEQPSAEDQVLELVQLEGEQLPLLSHLSHPVAAYLNGLGVPE